ncbi:unnamed protein product [Caenorhabditis auriculariae]|uniref:Uncharacterized protein n=1 Tax=Caenorhabditis auriculariae TaxID=2777116 RepID=A0A8S1GMI3_9PELO|nr:unnamed protein product [Caenorhabditis auriculariae]
MTATLQSLTTLDGAATSSSEDVMSSCGSRDRIKALNDRKFLFLSSVTRPDYRSVRDRSSPSPDDLRQIDTARSEPAECAALSAHREDGRNCAMTSSEASSLDLDLDEQPRCSSLPICVDYGVAPKAQFDEDEDFREQQENLEKSLLEDLTLSSSSHSDNVKNDDVPSSVENCDPGAQMRISHTGSPEGFGSLPKVASQPDSEPKKVESPEKIDEKQEKEETITISDLPKIVTDELDEVEKRFGSPKRAFRAIVAEDTLGSEDEDEAEEKHKPLPQHKRFVDEQLHLWHTDSQPNNVVLTSSSVDVHRAHSANQIDDASCIPDFQQLHPPVKFSIASVSSTPEHRRSADDAETDDVLQQSLVQLERQLRISDVRCTRLERICQFQQKDIDSLRYEVEWKDARIDYLQKALAEMEARQNP